MNMRLRNPPAESVVYGLKVRLVTVMKAPRFLWAIASVMIVMGVITPLLPGTATRYRPPSNLQRPSGRQGAATRNPCATDQFSFTPIVPLSNYGQTTANAPTMYWLLSNHSFPWAKFELYATQNLEPEATPLYEKTFRVEQREVALQRMTLPSDGSLRPLEVGRDYLWKVTLFCSPIGPDDESADGSQRSIQGWITPVAPSATLNTKLGQAPRKYDVYAEEGLWYDAIHDLAVARQQQPEDAQLESDWKDLLRETALQTNPLATKP
jgi:hypothetical protein